MQIQETVSRKAGAWNSEVELSTAWQLRVRCACAHRVSLLADRNTDRVLYPCWQLTDQLPGLCSLPVQRYLHSLPRDLQPPGWEETASNVFSFLFVSRSFAQTMAHSIDKVGINFPKALHLESMMQLIYCKWIAHSINKLLKDLNKHISEERQKISATQKHNLISSNRIFKM